MFRFHIVFKQGNYLISTGELFHNTVLVLTIVTRCKRLTSIQVFIIKGKKNTQSIFHVLRLQKKIKISLILILDQYVIADIYSSLSVYFLYQEDLEYDNCISSISWPYIYLPDPRANQTCVYISEPNVNQTYPSDPNVNLACVLGLHVKHNYVCLFDFR